MKRLDSTKVLLNTPKGVVMELAENILCIMSEGSYSEVVIVSGARHIVSRNLAYVQNVLPEGWFYRIHASVMINTNYLASICGNKVKLQNDLEFLIAQRRKKGFLESLRQNNISL